MQHYNSGRGAPLPYAEQCTNTASGGTCDPGELMAWLIDPESARPKSLDIDATSDPADGVELVNLFFFCQPQYLDGRAIKDLFLYPSRTGERYS